MSKQQKLKSKYDVIVAGGGPAGSTAGALLSEYGHDVLVLERESFPRFHVGESLIPATYWQLQRLGLIGQLKASAFPKKYSVQFVTDTGKESAPFYFDEHDPHESSQTWQVNRADFDQMLLDNAASKGATICTNANVREIHFDADRATGVHVQLRAEHGSEVIDQTVHADVVVDATGQSSFLANRLKLKMQDPLLKKGTVWTYFQGAHRDPGKDEGVTIILQTEGKKTWFWYIPLQDDIVSIGCTGDMHYMFEGTEKTPAAIFERELARCPGLQRRLKNATRCKDYFVTKDYSYKPSQVAGNGWVLIGDAGGFIDPVYSSGVFLALASGEFAADAIHEGFAKNDLSSAQLGRWYPRYSHGVELFRKLVYAFYTPGFRFGQFLRKYPQYQSNLVDLLMGNIFKPGVGEIFEALGDVKPEPQLANTPP